MSNVKGKNTGPELLIRKALFAKGYRYKLHDKSLPGKPDLVSPKYNTVIFKAELSIHAVPGQFNDLAFLIVNAPRAIGISSLPSLLIGSDVLHINYDASL